MNAHTLRARAAAKRDYLGFTQKAGIEDLPAWVNDMQARGLAANTVRQRYYLLRAWLGIDQSVQIPAPRAIHERKWLDARQVRALLSIIPLHETGRRDFALLTALLVSGQRVGQARLWRWRDVPQKTVPTVIRDAIQAIPERTKDSYFSNMPPALGNAFVFSTPKRYLGMAAGREIVPIDPVQPPGSAHRKSTAASNAMPVLRGWSRMVSALRVCALPIASSVNMPSQCLHRMHSNLALPSRRAGRS